MFIKTTFNSDLNHILNCVNKCDFGTKCFAKVEHFVLRLILLVLCLNISMVLGQEYKNWDKYDIEGFYTIAKSKAEAKISKNVLREGADYYIPTEMDDQVFPSGISKKITPKLYKLKDTEIYVFFTFPPFLYDSDNGMIEIKNNKGVFYKSPTNP